MSFQPNTVRAAEIRKEANYAGVRITLRKAIRATFDRRGTGLSPSLPFGLTDDFAQDAQKQTQWQAFLNKNRLEALRFEDVVAALRAFLLPVLTAAHAAIHFPHHWPAGGPWSPRKG